MIRTHLLPCALARDQADALNLESGRLYTRAMVEHYRTYRHVGHWLSSGALQKVCDQLERDESRPPVLHSHSIDAAQQGFVQAYHTAGACRRAGLARTRYPYRIKRWRTTIWKSTAIRRVGNHLTLPLARGRDPIAVTLPAALAGSASIREMRLVWDAAAARYVWHLVVEDGSAPKHAPGTRVLGVDFGEVHPAVCTDGEEATVISVRALRSAHRYTHKRLGALHRAQAGRVQGSRRWKRLQRRKHRFLAKQKRRTRDILHKVSRAVVDCAVGCLAGTIAVGDVRDIADGKHLAAKQQQKIGDWSHGTLWRYIGYKSEAEGMRSLLVDEAYTTQTCPQSGHRHKPTGRRYTCPDCGFQAHRDVVGAVNILSRQLHGRPGQVKAPSRVTYRYPFGRLSQPRGKA